MNSDLSRRGFFAGAAALAGWNRLAAAAKDDSGGIRLGVATYSLRKFNRPQAISMIKDMGVTWCNVKEFHLPYKDTPEQLAAGLKEFAAAGLKVYGGGTISLVKDDDDDIRKYFDYAKNCKFGLMVIAPTHQSMPRVEKFVKEYNIKVAIHNHGPEDKHFPTPESALAVVKNMDPRCGLCVDLGHAARTGVDVVEQLRMAGSRLLDIHIKDLRDLKDKDSQCPVGQGKMPIAAIFKQLKKMKYPGVVALEYEIDADNPFAGMKESFDYMRKVA
jgi:sugar phosphate isomerase/epimerase